MNFVKLSIFKSVLLLTLAILPVAAFNLNAAPQESKLIAAHGGGGHHGGGGFHGGGGHHSDWGGHHGDWGHHGGNWDGGWGGNYYYLNTGYDPYYYNNYNTYPYNYYDTGVGNGLYFSW